MQNKLNLGLFCRDFNNLADWEYRLFEKLLDHKHINIKIIYQKKFNKKAYNFRDILFKFFVRIEKLHSSTPKLESNIRNKVVKKLNKINLKKIDVKSSKYFDYFDKAISNEIKKNNLDLILRHDFNIIKGDVLNSTKYGIWSFHHGDTSKYKGGPSGFWEIIFNEAVTGVTLIKLNNILDGGKVIDKAFYSTKKNFLINNYFIMDKSLKLIIKNINILIKNKKIQFKKQNNYSNKIYKSPNIFFIFKYYLIILFEKLKKLQKKILKHVFRINSDIWTIFYDNKFQFDINTSLTFFPKKNQFWADPFYYSYKSKEYIFFEKFDFLLGKGVISVGNLTDDKLENIKDIIVKNHHLSYPQIFNYNKNLLMTCESWQDNKCVLYKSVNFPYNWKIYKSFLEGYNLADPTFYQDNKNLWLFVNLSTDMINDHDSELYIFLVKDNFENFIPHKLNPVITDSRFARNAGSIFKFKKKIIRPSQMNIHDKYGYGLNLRIIKKLNINEYHEEDYKSFKFNSNSKFNGIHHISKAKNGFIFDRRLKYVLK